MLDKSFEECLNGGGLTCASRSLISWLTFEIVLYVWFNLPPSPKQQCKNINHLNVNWNFTETLTDNEKSQL